MYPQQSKGNPIGKSNGIFPLSDNLSELIGQNVM